MTLPSWHALLAPIPADAQPNRQPVGSAEVLATPAGAAIAGWEQLVLELPLGPLGHRVVLVVLDRFGTVISASDSVLYRYELPEPSSLRSTPVYPVEILYEGVGGRFEPDGTFRGTRWRLVAPEPAEGEEPQWESTATEPNAVDVAALRALVVQLLERRPPRT